MEKYKIDAEREQQLMAKYDLSPLCARVLSCRGCDDDLIESLLTAASLQDPIHAKGMCTVVERIHQARAQKEKVLVCGDYDADGICATAIMVDALRMFGITCGFYIPDRLKEGYGLREKTVDMAKERGYSLLITVDNGVRAFEALKRAKRLGIDVIVTDHHHLDESQPLSCYSLLHPSLMGPAFSGLCGAGLAMEVSSALETLNERQIVYAGIASIGDVMKMSGETRSIVKLCIRLLNAQKARSIQLLANDSSVWDETKVAFQIVPKLNVTGRLSDRANANNTVRYLLSENGNDLVSLSKQISTLNDMRKAMSSQMYEVALNKADHQSDFIIISDDSFHEGLVGLVAGKLCDELQRPCMVLASKGDMLRGSIRSCNGVDLTDFFDGLKCLNEYGGHAQAAGISFARKDLSKVKLYVQQKMQQTVLQEPQEDVYIPVDEGMLTLEQVDSLKRIRPFGNGFEEPLFCIEDLMIAETRTLSGDKHMKWTSRSGMELLYFNVSSKMQDLKEGGFRSFGGTVGINQFRYQKKVNMIVSKAER